jgi:hypothetical protein
LYSSPSIIRIIKSRRTRRAGHVARICEKIFIGKSEGKRPLGKPGRILVGNIKIDLRKIGRSSMNWTNVVQDRDQWGL